MTEKLLTLEQLRWQCRRGMLELDLMLIPFVETRHEHCAVEEKLAFQALLHYPDPVLFDWVMGRAQPDEPELLHIVQLIRNHHTPSSF